MNLGEKIAEKIDEFVIHGGDIDVDSLVNIIKPLTSQLEEKNAVMLDALQLIMRCAEKGFISLKPPWHNKVRQAIRKAKGE